MYILITDIRGVLKTSGPEPFKLILAAKVRIITEIRL